MYKLVITNINFAFSYAFFVNVHSVK